MPEIQFRTLGTLDLRGPDGRELYSLLAQPKRVALLAYLCIAEPRGYHRRDTLLGLFWPDSDHEHARTSLRKSLHVLRRSLGEDAILSRGDEEVAVDFARISCDATTFQDLVSSGQLESAVEAYPGDLLPGFFVDEAPEFERWLASERARQKNAAARAAYTAAERLESAGNIIRALVFARRAFELAESDERSVRQLIALEAATGNRAAAIKTYETFASALASEYGTQPSAETIQLVERVRATSHSLPAPQIVTRESASQNRSVAEKPVSPTASGAGSPKRLRSRERILFAAAAISVVISGGWVWALMRPSASHQVLRYTLVVDSSETLAAGDEWWSRLAISPDGTRFAYIGGPRQELLLRPRNELRATAVPGTKGAETPFFSPDGKQVGYLGEDHVFIASTDGSMPVVVCDSLTGVAGASWGPDGFIYVDARAFGPLIRVPAHAGANPEYFTRLDTLQREVDHTWPDVLPNGKGVLFGVTFRAKGKDSLAHAIAVADIPSGKHHLIVPDAMYARYSTSGHLLYITTSKQLMVAPFDQISMRVTGEPRVLIDSMRLGTYGAADLAVSRTGTLVFATGAGDFGQRELVWVTRDGHVDQVDPEWLGTFWSPTISPDGTRLAITRRLATDRMDIFVKRLDRGPSVKLTLMQTDGAHPSWTPDGKYVSYSEDQDTPAVWRVRADGSGPPTFLFREHRRLAGETWSPDGKWLIYATNSKLPDSGDILAFRPGIDKSPRPLIATKYKEVGIALSPDGHWLAYSSNESGQSQIYVVPFPNVTDRKWAISSKGGTDPAWSHRGNELFYRDSAGTLVAAEITTTPTVSVGRVTPLFPTDGFQISTFFASHSYAVAPDGRRFLFSRRVRPRAERLIVVENWFEELRKEHQQF